MGDQLAAELFFFLGGDAGVAEDVDYAMPQDYAVGADHAGYGGYGGDLSYGDACLFKLGCDRSTAASGCPSSGGEDYGIDS